MPKNLSPNRLYLVNILYASPIQVYIVLESWWIASISLFYLFSSLAKLSLIIYIWKYLNSLPFWHSAEAKVQSFLGKANVVVRTYVETYVTWSSFERFNGTTTKFLKSPISCLDKPAMLCLHMSMISIGRLFCE
jgi:hypothetical protein